MNGTWMAFWADPSQYPKYHPENYLKKSNEETQYIVDIVRRYGRISDKILEIGGNCGVAVTSLFNSGYKKIGMVEVNNMAIELFKKSFPDAAKSVKTYWGPAEMVIPCFDDGSWDVVYTKGVLEHIHPENAWLLWPEIARIVGKYLILVEEEKYSSDIVQARNYKEIFEMLGLVQVEERDDPANYGICEGHITRVFKKIK